MVEYWFVTPKDAGSNPVSLVYFTFFIFKKNIFTLYRKKKSIVPTLRQILKIGRIHKIRGNRISALDKSPQKKGVCTKVYTTKPKKPNSAIRKIAKVKLTNGKKIIAYIPGIGHNLQEHSVVLIRAGRVPDLPGMKFKILRGKYDAAPVANRSKRRSFYGVKKKKIRLCFIQITY